MASRLWPAALGLLLAVALAGCVSMPNGGPVLSFPVTQSPDGQAQAVVMQRVPQAPQPTWKPEQIVWGFITASGSLSLRTAQEYLTPGYSKKWNTSHWSATVYSQGPYPQLQSISKTNPKVKGRQQQTAVVTVSGAVQASVQGGSGHYTVAQPKTKPQTPTFDLVKEPGGPWRIYHAPNRLLIDSDTFKLDYQQRNLYFFNPDPAHKVLVPDPVYVPQNATPAELTRNLVNDLNSPPSDWLTAATDTAFALLPDAKVGAVTLDGTTATVSLTTTAKRPSPAVLQQIYSQLSWTLTGSGQVGSAVKSFVLTVNGTPFASPGSQGNPVQNSPAFSPPLPATSGLFYYLDSSGYLVRQDGAQGAPHRIGTPLGKGFTQIAVSPPIGGAQGPQYLAALRGGASGGGTLYTGRVGGKLAPRGTGYNSMSWAPDGYLWATSMGQIFRLPGNVSAGKPAGQPELVSVPSEASPITAIRVAPDGVRVAIIVDHSTLNFGAITHVSGVRPSEQDINIKLSPFYVAGTGATLTAASWYGPDNVIALGMLSTGGPVLTEYAVNGGSSTRLPVPPRVQTITAADPTYSLIAGVAKSGMWSDASVTGAWASISSANSEPVKGVSPVYPG